MRNVIGLLAGLLFGFGLAVAQMTDPAKIINFLDFSGTWNPTLAFVLAGAVLVTGISFRFILKRPKPVLESRFHLPAAQAIDTRVILGSAIFGVGWGLGGYCPGPGVAAIASGMWAPLVFVAGLVLGTLSYRWLQQGRPLAILDYS